MGLAVSTIRSNARIILDDPIRWNEVDLGIGLVPSQRVYQLPTKPIALNTEVVTIDNVGKTRNVDYTVLPEAGQLYFATPPNGGSMHVYWQYSRWSDTQLNQFIAEAARLLSVHIPKLVKTTRTISVQQDVTSQGWYVDPNTIAVRDVRIFDPLPPSGSGTGWQSFPYFHFDVADQWLGVEGAFLLNDQFQYMSRERWKDPDVTGDLFDAGYDDFQSGLSTTFDATHATDANAAWTTNQWTGYTADAGNGNTGVISANTATSATVASWSGGTPGAGTTFQIHQLVTVGGTASTVSSTPSAIEILDPVTWLVASFALSSREADRDMAALEGQFIDAQGNPTGAFVKDAQIWRKKFDDWLSFYRGPNYFKRPGRAPSVL